MSESSESAGASRRASTLAYVLAALVVLTLGALATWFGFLRTVQEAPHVAGQELRELVADIGELGRAFQQHTVTRRFISHGTSVEGTSRLQVATLEQTEVFELEDEATAFWGALELPAVRVRATAPVTTTYYVDFERPWSFELEGRRVTVTAPPLTPNTPAIDASEIQYEVREGSLLRDEDLVLEQLKRELTTRAASRAEDNAALVRDTARVRIESFVRSWFHDNFGDGGEYEVEVRFEGEASAAPRTRSENAGDLVGSVDGPSDLSTHDLSGYDE